MALKGRSGRAKKTHEEVAQIRALHAEGKLSVQEIADRFALSKSGAEHIIYRKRWRH